GDALARLLHERGPRASEPFVAVDCAASRGVSFATEVARARGGTLFLKEVGALSPAAQTELLRAIRSPPRRARLIAATRIRLVSLVREGRFREDLFRRLRDSDDRGTGSRSDSRDSDDDSDAIESEYFI